MPEAILTSEPPYVNSESCRQVSRYRRLLDLLPGRANHSEKQYVLFAFQIMHGTLNNMVLINPEPFTIHHPNTGRMLATAMRNLIERQA